MMILNHFFKKFNQFYSIHCLIRFLSKLFPSFSVSESVDENMVIRNQLMFLKIKSKTFTGALMSYCIIICIRQRQRYVNTGQYLNHLIFR